MEGNIMLLLPVLFPIVMGILVLTVKGWRASRRAMVTASAIGMAGGLAFILLAASEGDTALRLWRLTAKTSVSFRADGAAMLFGILTAVMWLLVGIFAFKYMTHEREEHRFFGYYLIVLGVLMGLDLSANLITFYIFYELMTLTSLPLVLHERTKEAVAAGLKYLFYSVAGAFLALFGIFFLTTLCEGELTFTPGGIVTSEMAAGHEGMLLAAVCCMIVGFGTKAGMFPLHGWLPTAHPVAPAPASAVLSGVITKAGVLAVLRVVYYIVGPELIRGTWVQDVWMSLSLMTVFMGSMLAYREPLMKKRLAYSTVSQVSYIMFGLSLLNPTALVGALSHVVFHSIVKNALFLSAGAIIFTTGWTKVGEMRGLGRIMPVTLWSYTIVSLSLVGIPPTSGFISKWYLAQGALSSNAGAFTWLGPAVLLVSALLTAGYLLPLTINGFLPGADFDGGEIVSRGLVGKEPSKEMVVPVVILAAAALIFGLFPNPLTGLLGSMAEGLF